MPVRITVNYNGRITREINLDPGERHAVPFYDPVTKTTCGASEKGLAKVAVIGCANNDWGMEVYVLEEADFQRLGNRIVVSEETLAKRDADYFAFGGWFELPVSMDEDCSIQASLLAQHIGELATIASPN